MRPHIDKRMELYFKNFFEAHQPMKTRLAIFDFDSTLARVPETPHRSTEAQSSIKKLNNARKKHRAAHKSETSTARQRQSAKLDMDNAEKVVHDHLGGWDGKDWWGSEASLGDTHFPGKPMNDSIVDAMRQAKVDPNTHVAMITGRRDVASDHVRNVLKHHDLHGKRYIPDSNEKAIDNHVPHANDEGPGSHDESYSGDLRTEPDYPQTAKGKPVADTWAHKEYAVVNKLMHNNIRVIETWDDRSDHIPHWKSMGDKLFKMWPNLESFVIHQVFNNQSGHYVIDIPVKK